jgi:hypothetical protein
MMLVVVVIVIMLQDCGKSIHTCPRLARQILYLNDVHGGVVGCE